MAKIYHYTYLTYQISIKSNFFQLSELALSNSWHQVGYLVLLLVSFLIKLNSFDKNTCENPEKRVEYDKNNISLKQMSLIWTWRHFKHIVTSHQDRSLIPGFDILNYVNLAITGKEWMVRQNCLYKISSQYLQSAKVNSVPCVITTFVSTTMSDISQQTFFSNAIFFSIFLNENIEEYNVRDLLF